MPAKIQFGEAFSDSDADIAFFGIPTLTGDIATPPLINAPATIRRILSDSPRNNTPPAAAKSGTFDLAPAVGFVTSRAGSAGRTLTQTYTVTAHQVMLQRRLRNGASVSIAVGDVQTTVRPSIKSSYDFTSVMTMAAEIEATSVKGGAESSRFDEIAGRLTFTRRF